MTSRRDRVVRARTTSRATMSDHRSWREFTWVSGGGRTGIVVRASDSGSGDPGSIRGRVGVLFP